MGLFSRLWSGKNIQCPACKNGILKPQRQDLPIRENLQFVCPKCGNKITAILSFPKAE